MPTTFGPSSARIRHLSDELRAADNSLKADPAVDGSTLREFRQALDNIRLTAWTVSELQNARDTQRSTRAMASFLTAERLRRFRSMLDDFCADLAAGSAEWPMESINDLQESVGLLRERLGLLSMRQKA